MLNKWKAIK